MLSLFYSLQRGSNGFITEKTILLQGSRGGPTFSGGGGVQGVVQMLIFIETHITCDPPSGSAHVLDWPIQGLLCLLYNNKHFANSSPDNQHFNGDEKEKSIQTLITSGP